MSNDKVLLLLRNNPPYAGLWNGLGGKIHPFEEPDECVRRELSEETVRKMNLVIANKVWGAGIVTWNGFPENPDQVEGMYVYFADVPWTEEAASLDRLETREGRLEWFDIQTLLAMPDITPSMQAFFGAMHTEFNSPTPQPLHVHLAFDGQDYTSVAWPLLQSRGMLSSITER